MSTQFDYRCPECRRIVPISGTVGQPPIVICPDCTTPQQFVFMERYFGNQREMRINFGERAHHDDIERFRFQNL